jgi:hypothetical protein
MMSDSKSKAWHDTSLPDHVNLARFVAGKGRKPKPRTCYMYRNSALSAAGAIIMCEYIQKEWANLQVKQNELLIHMMLYQVLVLQSENLVMGEDDETELLELCFLAEWSMTLPM